MLQIMILWLGFVVVEDVIWDYCVRFPQESFFMLWVNFVMVEDIAGNCQGSCVEVLMYWFGI